MIYFLLFISILIFGCDGQKQSQQEDKASLEVGECIYLPNRYVQSIDGELKVAVTYDRYCLKPIDEPTSINEDK